MTIIKDILSVLGGILGKKPSKKKRRKTAPSSRSYAARGKASPLKVKSKAGTKKFAKPKTKTLAKFAKKTAKTVKTKENPKTGVTAKKKAAKTKIKSRATAKKAPPRPGQKTAAATGKKTVKKKAKTVVAKTVKRKTSSGQARTAAKAKVINKTSAAKKRPDRKNKSSVRGTFKKKPVKPQPAAKKAAAKTKDFGLPIGRVTHYFSKIKVCVVAVSGRSLLVGDNIRIKGRSTDLKQKAGSLQVESRDVKVAPRGSLVGLKVRSKVRVGDKVYRQP